MNPVLVLGYGSTLRRDDAAGRVVAEGVAALALPGVEVGVLHQLTPELAASICGRSLVVFVDASVTAGEVCVEPLDACTSSEVSSHHVGPARLLGFASLIGEPPAEAVVVSVPATDLGFGTELSEGARAAAVEAVEVVAALVT